MALVDALETQLAASRATAANLLSALVAELTAVMEKLVNEGRSTPGAKQANDVPVNWKRLLEAQDAPKKAPAKKAKQQ